MIITPTSLTITQLFGSTNEQYVIPTYQRRYSWHERQVWELIDDILLIDEGDTHLLGSIVCHRRSSGVCRKPANRGSGVSCRSGASAGSRRQVLDSQGLPGLASKLQ